MSLSIVLDEEAIFREVAKRVLASYPEILILEEVDFETLAAMVEENLKEVSPEELITEASTQRFIAFLKGHKMIS